MAQVGDQPRALFLFPDEPPEPDMEVCSGRYRAWLEGAVCPYSDQGRIPLPGGQVSLASGGAAGSGPASGGGSASGGGGQLLPGAAGADAALAFPCMVAQLGRLANWRGDLALRFPPELGRLTLFKCKQMFLLVVLWEAESA